MDKCTESPPINLEVLFINLLDSSSVSSEESDSDFPHESDAVINKSFMNNCITVVYGGLDLQIEIENNNFTSFNILFSTSFSSLGYESSIEVNNLNALESIPDYFIYIIFLSKYNSSNNNSSHDYSSEGYDADDEYEDDCTESDHTEEYSDDDSILNEAVDIGDISPFISPLGSEDSGYFTSPDQLG